MDQDDARSSQRGTRPTDRARPHQAELASRSGVSRDWVNSFERGKRTVEISLVFRLFDALGIGVEAMDASTIAAAPAGPQLSDADYRHVRELGREYLSRNPRSLA